MRRQSFLAASLFAVALLAATADSQAAGYCPSRPNGVCPTLKKPKPLAPKTDAERSKLAEQARDICRKRYGAIARVHHIDKQKRKVWCTVD